ncbi:DoxX family protein [Edaphobacter sp. HDX4]|uniref:DoxX family protein n=1 Tax=Edaphobacter sp. HDX4 TaxID=2794064 RepID=UPI002FE55C5C
MRKNVYRMTTGIVALALLAGGIADAIHIRPVAEAIKRIGYPVYLLTILGCWKILGATALVWPGLPRLKEWAYAGVFFLMTAAAISHAVCGEKVYVIAPVSLAALGLISWWLRPPVILQTSV